ncbi:MAG: hypothetical protein WCY37_04990 [Candidatus Dojkabacteria bacterium]
MHKEEREMSVQIVNKRGTLEITIEGFHDIEAKKIIRPLGEHLEHFLRTEAIELLEKTDKDFAKEMIEEMKKKPGLEEMGNLLGKILEEVEETETK